MANEDMRFLASNVASKKKRYFFGSKRIFEFYQSVSIEELGYLEKKLNINIPDDVKTWIAVAGLGDINGQLAFRLEFFSVIDLHGIGRSLVFAQDILGNYYAHSEVTGNIYYIERSIAFVAKIAEDFFAFIQEYEQRQFQLDIWIIELHNTKRSLRGPKGA